ncbi:hypothetical protein AbraIFM66950_009541 [Aspergillus brasiliensis]|nr:hypothetical protein AbraIFM66950_009541 [Aspergillus brasiliensis]
MGPSQRDILNVGVNGPNSILPPHGVQIYASFEETITVKDLEAVVIASSTALHVPQTLAALDRGLHVLCEKPISTSVAELSQIVTRLQDQSTTASLMVAFMRRFDESYQAAYQKVQAGYLRTCGGSFIDAVIRDIDLSLMFLGEDSIPKSCSAHGVNAVFEDLAQMGDADNAVGICEYWDGKIAHFYLSRTSGAAGYDNQSEIWGLEGKIGVKATPRRDRVEVSDVRGIHTDAIPTWYDRYAPAFVSEAIGWVEAILEGKPMPVPLSSSWKALVIADALQESLRTGTRVNFDRDGKRLLS